MHFRHGRFRAAVERRPHSGPGRPRQPMTSPGRGHRVGGGEGEEPPEKANRDPNAASGLTKKELLMRRREKE
ncbi:hypothetical protein ACWCSH_48375, partial [Streptosporangium sp. NPDC001682]